MSNGRPYRSSLFAGLLLILLGVVFLLDRTYPGFQIGHLVRLYWPVLLILWGGAKLLDRLSERGAGGSSPPMLSGGEAVLLVLIGLVLSAFAFGDWAHQHFPGVRIDLPSFQDNYSQSIPLAPQTLAPGARVSIVTGRGDVTVHAGDGNTVVVTAKKSGPGPDEQSALDRIKSVSVEMYPQGNGVLIRPTHMDGGLVRVDVDLDVSVPKASPVSVDAAHGDVAVSGVAAPLEIRAANGDVTVRNAGADVSLESESGDIHVDGVRGNLRLSGRGDDVAVANVQGDATIQGAFSGDISLRNIAKSVSCETQFSEVALAGLTGQMKLDSDDVSVSGVSGDARLVTRNKDISADHVAGKLDIVDSHGDINVSYAAPPRADASIENDSADVSVTLPSNSSFSLSAISRGGEVNSDFGSSTLKPVNDEEMQQLAGQFGSGGPKISIATTYGTIQLHKSH